MLLVRSSVTTRPASTTPLSNIPDAVLLPREAATPPAPPTEDEVGPGVDAADAAAAAAAAGARPVDASRGRATGGIATDGVVGAGPAGGGGCTDGGGGNGTWECAGGGSSAPSPSSAADPPSSSPPVGGGAARAAATAAQSTPAKNRAAAGLGTYPGGTSSPRRLISSLTTLRSVTSVSAVARQISACVLRTSSSWHATCTAAADTDTGLRRLHNLRTPARSATVVARLATAGGSFRRAANAGM